MDQQRVRGSTVATLETSRVYTFSSNFNVLLSFVCILINFHLLVARQENIAGSISHRPLFLLFPCHFSFSFFQHCTYYIPVMFILYRQTKQTRSIGYYIFRFQSPKRIHLLQLSSFLRPFSRVDFNQLKLAVFTLICVGLDTAKKAIHPKGFGCGTEGPRTDGSDTFYSSAGT